MDWHLKTYYSLITKAKAQEEEISKSIYHIHHILPRCMGGTNDSDNLVKLPIRWHIIAHQLLSMAYPDNFKLLKAATMMLTVSDKSGKILYKVSSRLAAAFGEEYSQAQKGKMLSEETRRKMSESRKGHITSDDTKLKISISETGKVVSEETKKKLVGRKVNNITKQKLSDAAKDRMSNIKNKEILSNSLKLRGELNNTRNIKITDGIIEFSSIKDCAIYYNTSTKKIYEKLKDINSGFKVLENKKDHRIEGPDGVVYESLRSCSSKTGFARKTLRNWINNYPEKGYKYV